MINLLHTSDLHLGRTLHGFSLIEDQRLMLKNLSAIVKDSKVDALLVSGDIFDRSIPSAEAVELFDQFITEISASGASQIIIPGNHDSSSRLAYGSELLSSSGIHIRHCAETMHEAVLLEKESGKLAVYALPFLYPRSIENVPEGLTQEEHALSLIAQSKEEGLCSIILAHLFAGGSVTSDSERLPVGALHECNASYFKDFDYAALGHLHRPQDIADNASYSGSPLKYSFSEYKDNKSAVLLSYDGKSLHKERIILDQPREMTVLKASIDELMQSPDFEDFTDMYLEAHLTDRTLIPRPSELLSRRFPWLLSVRQSPDEIMQYSSSIDYDPAHSLTETYKTFVHYVSGEEPSKDKIALFETIAEDEVEHEA